MIEFRELECRVEGVSTIKSRYMITLNSGSALDTTSKDAKATKDKYPGVAHRLKKAVKA